MRIHELQAEAVQGTEDTTAKEAESGKKPLGLRVAVSILVLCCMLLAASSALPVFATPTPAASGTAIDSSMVGELVDLVKQVAGLFSVFPINVFLIGSLAGLGFMLFRKAKNVAKN